MAFVIYRFMCYNNSEGRLLIMFTKWASSFERMFIMTCARACGIYLQFFHQTFHPITSIFWGKKVKNANGCDPANLLMTKHSTEKTNSVYASSQQLKFEDLD